MYEDQTFPLIIERMLARVPDDMDKREGSIIYDAIAPAAAELAQMYIELGISLNLSSASTSTGEYLDRAIAWKDIIRKEATYAQLRGLFYAAGDVLMDVPIGSRFSINDMNYSVLERISVGSYRLAAETIGLAGNQYVGALTPIDTVPNLVRALISEVLVPGTDRETDDSLRARFFDAVRRPATSGNKYHYVTWAQEVEGVGLARVFPLWNGPKTVKVVITDAMRQPATPTLVQQVQDYIDPVAGNGEGQAPIGAFVTIASAAGKTVNISATVTLAAGYSLQDAVNNFKDNLEAWRKGAAFNAQYISLPVIGAQLLSTEGVLDYNNLLLNGSAANVALTDDQVPVIGTVNLEV